jgi:hypothetical protein
MRGAVVLDSMCGFAAICQSLVGSGIIFRIINLLAVGGGKRGGLKNGDKKQIITFRQRRFHLLI